MRTPFTTIHFPDLIIKTEYFQCRDMKEDPVYDHLSKKAPIFREEMNCEAIILFHEMGKQK